MCIRIGLGRFRSFFETYKRLEPRKWAKFKDWRGVDGAAAIVTSAMEKYKKMAELYKK